MSYKYRISIIGADGDVRKVVHEGGSLEKAVMIQNKLAADHAQGMARNGWHFELHKSYAAINDVYHEGGSLKLRRIPKAEREERQIW